MKTHLVKVKVISILLILTLFLISFSSFTAADEKNTSSVIGYGPIAEDLILPSSTLVHEDKIYVLDQYSITVFDVSSKKVVEKHLLDDQNFLSDYESPENIRSVIKDFTLGPPSILYEILGIGPKQMLYTQKRYYVQPSLCLDSKNRLYVTAQDGIHVLDIDTLSQIKILPYPEILLEKPKSRYEKTIRNIITMKLYQDQLFFMKTISYLSTPKNISMIRLDLDGNILEVVDFNFTGTADSNIDRPDFIYIQELQMYGVLYMNYDLHPEVYQFDSILFFNTKGEQVNVDSDDTLGIMDSTCIDYCQSNKQIIIAGEDSSGFDDSSFKRGPFVLFHLHLEQVKENHFKIIIDKAYQKEEFGMDCLGVSCNKDSITLVSSGRLEENRNCRVYRLQEEAITQYGTLPTREGQVYQSMSFCVDTEDTLFVHSNSQSYMNIYKKNEIEVSKMDLDLNWMTRYFPVRFPYELPYTPFLGDIICNDQDIVFTGIFPNTISSYNYIEEKWSLQFKGDFVPSYLWLDMQFYHEELYVLDTIQISYIPILCQPDDMKEVNIVRGFERAKEEDFEEPPLFVGFNITDVQYENDIHPEYQFLDCQNKTIWIYDYEKKLQEIVQLPQDENSFYLSFDLYPDGSWIVTDVTQHRLLHIARNGELIETIGSKGQVEIGTTKEAYLEKPDQFYFPIRAKIVNNNIYVSDFGNCRYHKIPLE